SIAAPEHVDRLAAREGGAEQRDAAHDIARPVVHRVDRGEDPVDAKAELAPGALRLAVLVEAVDLPTLGRPAGDVVLEAGDADMLRGRVVDVGRADVLDAAHPPQREGLYAFVYHRLPQARRQEGVVLEDGQGRR